MWTLRISVFLWIAYTACDISQCLKLNLNTATLSDVASAISSRNSSCEEIISGYIDRIKRYNSSIGAVISINNRAVEDARNLDKEFNQTRMLRPYLHCAPVLVKDTIDVSGMATSAGLFAFSKIYPMKDASVVANVKKYGAIILGKANLSPVSSGEAWGSSETGGTIRNPFGLNYTTYGSSGGNAAAIAARLAIISLGTETGVSVNMPSSATNIVGFRMPVGMVNTSGVVPNSIFQDIVGPMARNVEDAAKAFDAMLDVGTTPQYSSSAVLNVTSLKGMKVNILETFAYGTFSVPGKGEYRVNERISRLFNDMVRNLQISGAIVSNVTASPAAIHAFGVMMTTSTDSCMAAWRNAYFSDPTRFNTSTSPYRSVADVVSAKVLPSYYQKQWSRHLSDGSNPLTCTTQVANFRTAQDNLINTLSREILSNFTADFAIWPALPQFPDLLPPEAFKREYSDEEPMPINIIMLASITGFSSMTIPLGFSEARENAPEGLPVGAHLHAHPKNVDKLFRAAYAYQKQYGISKIPRLVA